jgi:septal ring-binding cell division protein DamX
MKDILGGLLMLVLVFGGGYCTGKHYEQEAQQAEVDRLNTEARAKEKALEAAVTTTANALRVTNEKAKLATKQRDAAIDAGAYKLRVPVKTTCPTVSAATDTPAPTGGSGGETSAELSPEAGKALFAIAEEGDRAITKLNACIDLYNKALESQKGIK